MVNRQNITLSLPKTLLRRAKLLAARKETSLSQLVRETLEEKLSADTGYKKARERQVALLEKGFDLGTKGRMRVSRDELHARR